MNQQVSKFVLAGGDWDPSPSAPLGGPPIVTWSLPPAGLILDPSLGAGAFPITPLSSFLSIDFQDILSSAFDAWSAVSNIDFIQVPDGLDNVGEETFGDVRIFGLPLDGPGATLAGTYPLGLGPISGDLILETPTNRRSVFGRLIISCWSLPMR